MISVLYVDDEPGLLEVCKLFLEQKGEFSVDTIASAPEALALLGSKTYDAIIADYQMPGMDGIEFLKTVRASGNAVPFILFTGRGREEVVIQALNEGADFYLQKGGEPRSQFAELANKVRYAVTRRRAEDKLRLSENRLRMAQIIGKTGSWELDLATGTIWASEEAFGMFGIPRSPDGTISLEDIESKIPERERVHRALVGLIENGADYNLEYAIVYPGNSGQKIINSVAKILYDDGKKPVRVVGVIHDVSDRKRVEVALRETKNQYDTMVSNIPVGIYIVRGTPRGTLSFEYVSPQFAKMFNVSAEAVLADPNEALKLVHPDDLKSLLDVNYEKFNREQFQQSQAFRWDGRIVVRGDLRWFHIESSPVALENGDVVWNGVVTDITDRVAAEKALRESEEKYRTIVEASPDITWEIDTRGNFTYVSSQSLPLLGYSPEELIGKPFIILVRPEARESVMVDFQSSIRDKTPFATLEIPAINQSGLPLFLEIRTAMIRDDTGNLTGFRGLARDITGRNLAKAALAESEERYRSLVETTGTGFVILGSDGRVITANGEYLRLTGRMTLQELQGRQVTEWTAPYDIERNARAVQQCLATGKIRNLEIDYRKPEGTIQPVEINASVSPSGSGQIIMTLCRDIANRKRTEMALRESETKYRALFAAESDGILVVDRLTGTIIDCNDAFPLMYGYRKDELIGRPNTDTSAEPDASRSATQEGTPHIPIRYHKRKDGSVFPVEITTNVVSLQGRDVIIAAVRDITERKHAEEALRENEEKFRMTFDTARSSLIILEVTPDGKPGKILEVNKTAYTQLGCSREELLGKSFFELDAPEYRNRIAGQLAALSAAGIASYESVRIRKDGGRFPVEVNVHHALMNGKPVIITSARDITGRKLAEEAFRQANKKLNLLSGITRHDINNQLSLLRSYLALLEEQHPKLAGDRYFQQVGSAAKRISSMIQFTKEYDQIGVNEPVWEDIRTVIENAAKDASLGSIRLINDIPAGTEVFADPLIVRVFYNLVDNAVRYGGKITTIRFSTQVRGGDTVVVCEDDGDGIRAEEKEQIFERGYGKNTGLGLALSREILDITGITIRETGEPGKGARFEIRVPSGKARTRHS
jgi:PAS domain S-box-containing protein